MPTYQTNEEILSAIRDDRTIMGVVEVDWDWCLEEHFYHEINEKFTNELVGENHSDFLYRISYRLVGCNVSKQTVLVEVTADVEELMFNEDSDFALWYGTYINPAPKGE